MITTRFATLADLPILLSFEQGIIDAERPMDPTLKEAHISYYDVGAMIEAHDVAVIVAEEMGQIVGSGYARISEAKPYLRYNRYAFLGFMYVPPSHRGRGVNGLVIDALEVWVKEQGLTEMRLDVYADNPPALRAYEKMGFSSLLVTMRKSLED